MGYTITYWVDGEPRTHVDGPLGKVIARVRELRAWGHRVEVATEDGTPVEIDEDAIQGKVD